MVNNSPRNDLKETALVLGFNDVQEMNAHQVWLDAQRNDYAALIEYQNSDEAIERKRHCFNKHGITPNNIVFVIPA